MIAHMGEVVQDNYPEVVKRSFIVNGKTRPVIPCLRLPGLSQSPTNHVPLNLS